MINAGILPRYFLKLVGVLALSATLSACMSRPLPKNAVRYNTYEITQKIRCEFRDAIRELVIGLLRSNKQFNTIQQISERKLSYDRLLREKDDLLDVDSKRIIERYELSAIAYEFNFDITEENNLNGGVDFLEILTRGQFKLGVTAQHDKKRQNIRNFRTSDNFGELISGSIMERVCARIERPDRGNHVYPISGSLDLAEIVDTFISLNQSSNLVGNTKGAEKIPTLSDTLTFTTTISGTVNPTIKLSPLGDSFQLTDATLSATSSRTDVHKLVLALTLPNIDFLTTGLTIAQTREEIERAALRELERQRIRAIDSDTEIIRDNLLGR